MAAGTVADLWIDTPEHLIRYLEVDVGGGKRALFPFALAVVEGDSREIKVQSLMSHQFANAPGLSDPNQVTRLEEEKIYGYLDATVSWRKKRKILKETIGTPREF